MREFEERVKCEARSYWQGVNPDPAFVEHLIHTVEFDGEHRAPFARKSWGRIAAVGMAASALLAVSLPGVRAVATDVIRRVFRIGPTVYVVHSGSDDPALVAEEPEADDLDPQPNSNDRWFYTSRGELPADAVTALEEMSQAGPVTGDEFRLPAWLPEDAPKRLQLPLESDEYDWPRYDLVVKHNGKTIMVRAKSPQVSVYRFAGTTQRDARIVTLGSVEGLELREGNTITYYLTTDNVTYRVSGPATETEVLKRIAESLLVQDR